MGPSGYYTASYEQARSSSKSSKKAKRASRRKERGEQRQASRSESRQEDKANGTRKQSMVANNDNSKQRHADAASVKRPESTKVERRDA